MFNFLDTFKENTLILIVLQRHQKSCERDLASSMCIKHHHLLDSSVAAASTPEIFFLCKESLLSARSSPEVGTAARMGCGRRKAVLERGMC